MAYKMKSKEMLRCAVTLMTNPMFVIFIDFFV